jgi:glucokinase
MFSERSKLYGLIKRMLLGIEIGGTKLQVVVGDDDGNRIWSYRFNVNKENGAEGIRASICLALEIIRNSDSGKSFGIPQERITGVGVGFGGPVNWRNGKIACSHQIEGWSGFDLGSWLRELTATPVRVDNDANTACLGEAIRGAGQGKNPVFYVTLGSGVGGGLVVDEKIYHGGTPGEAEIGHIRLDRTGTIVEDRCSGWAVDRRIVAAVQQEPGGTLAHLCLVMAKGGEARHLVPALKDNDPLAQRILSETAEDLSFALSHAVHLCHPEVIVIGGGLSLVGEPLRAAVAAALPKFVMHAFHPAPAIALAGLGEDSVPTGALLLAKQAAESLK